MAEKRSTNLWKGIGATMFCGGLILCLSQNQEGPIQIVESSYSQNQQTYAFTYNKEIFPGQTKGFPRIINFQWGQRKITSFETT